MHSLLKAPLKLSAAVANEAVFLYHAPRVWLRRVQIWIMIRLVRQLDEIKS